MTTQASEIPLHAIHRDAAGNTDGLAHLVEDGQLQDDSMISLCGIVVANRREFRFSTNGTASWVGDGTWELPFGNNVEAFMLPLCAVCRAQSS